MKTIAQSFIISILTMSFSVPTFAGDVDPHAESVGSFTEQAQPGWTSGESLPGGGDAPQWVSGGDLLTEGSGVLQKPAIESVEQRAQYIQLTSAMGIGVGAQIQSQVASCKKAANVAKYACLRNLSPHIQTAVATVGMLTSVMGSNTSTSQACGKAKSAMDTVKKALMLYNAACGGAQLYCSTSCGNVVSMLGQAQAQIKPVDPGDAAAVTADRESIRTMLGTFGEQKTVCGSFTANLASAALNLASVIRQRKAAAACEVATRTDGGDGGSKTPEEVAAACAKNPADPVCFQKEKVDCSDAKFSQKPECICMQKPNSPGCAGYTGKTSLASKGPSSNRSNSTGAKPSVDPKDSAPSSAFDEGMTPVSPTGGSGSNSLAGGGGGGAGGGLGGGGGAGGAKGGTDARKNDKMNSNILSGYDGGGGGGGRGGKGFGGFDPNNSKYKAYLPGGAKDPIRGIASKTFANGEITGAGSKSNWEKVSDRYRDNKSTLMAP